LFRRSAPALLKAWKNLTRLLTTHDSLDRSPKAGYRQAGLLVIRENGLLEAALPAFVLDRVANGLA
jgi:hypothetical protein